MKTPMKKTALCLAVGAAMTTTGALAEPVPLTTAQLDGVTAGGILNINADTDIFLDKFVNINVFQTVEKFTNVSVNTSGYQADAIGAANCLSGGGCVAETTTATDVFFAAEFTGADGEVHNIFNATAVSESFSATSGF